MGLGKMKEGYKHKKSEIQNFIYYMITAYITFLQKYAQEIHENVRSGSL